MTEFYTVQEIANRAMSEGPDIVRTFAKNPALTAALEVLGLTLGVLRQTAMQIGRTAAVDFLKTAASTGGKYSAEVAAEACRRGAVAAEKYLSEIFSKTLAKIPPPALAVTAAVAAVAAAGYNAYELNKELENEGPFAKERYGENTMGTRFVSSTEGIKDEGARSRRTATDAVDEALDIDNDDKFLVAVLQYYTSLQGDLKWYRQEERINAAQDNQKGILSQALDKTAETMAIPFIDETWQDTVNIEEDMTLRSKIDDGYRLLDRLRASNTSKPEILSAISLLENELLLAETLYNEERASNEQEHDALEEEKENFKNLISKEINSKWLVAKVQEVEKDLQTRDIDTDTLGECIQELTNIRRQIDMPGVPELSDIDQKISVLAIRISKIPRIIDSEVRYRGRTHQRKGKIPHKGENYFFEYDKKMKKYQIWTGVDKNKTQDIPPTEKPDKNV
jgi:hypothetical protein